MFFYQTPLVAEMLIRSDDFSILKQMFQQKPMGLINKDFITDEDIEVFKYTFSQPGKIS